MTKSLLTPKDIKNFIYKVIQDVHPCTNEVYYGIYKLSEITGISVHLIRKYTNKGMPFTSNGKVNKYNINKVIEWLNKNNIEFTINNNV
jgi:hypothetical protein